MSQRHSKHRPPISALALIVPFVIALWIVIPSDQAIQFVWRPEMADLWAYRSAGQALVEGRDPYRLSGSFPYIYPPIAAVLAVPMSWLPWRMVELLHLLGNMVLLLWVLHRLGLRGAWQLAAAASASLLFLRAFADTLNLGQVGIILLALVVADLVPPPGGRRRIPQGIWLGLATGLKLTPAVFIVYLLVTGRRKAAGVAVGSFAVTVLIGLLVSPQFAPGYWLRLMRGDSGANPDAYGWINNISLLSAVQRFTGVTRSGTILGLGLSALLVLLALAVAYACWRAGQELLGVSILGLASSLANPIAWFHHLTFVLPLVVVLLGIGVARGTEIGPLRRTGLLIGALWLACMPQSVLPGAPWADQEINRYTTGQKVFAAGPELAMAVLLLAAWPGLAALRRTRAEDRAAAREPDGVTT